jgi:hypothetical protein
MLTIPGHKGNASQNHTESTSFLLEWLSLRTPPTKNAEEYAGKKEPSHTAGKNVS